MTTRLVEASPFPLARWFVAGAAAGVLSNISGMMLGGLVLADDMRVVLGRLESPPAPIVLFLTHVTLRMILGLAVAWFVVVTRPRFRHRTPFVTAAFCWLLSYCFSGVILWEFEIYSARTTAIALAWALGECGSIAVVAERILGTQEVRSASSLT